MLTIDAALLTTTIEERVNHYKDMSYQDFKLCVADHVVAALKPIQEKYHALINDPSLDAILDAGRDKAKMIAHRKLQKVYKKIGFQKIKKRHRAMSFFIFYVNVVN